MKPNSQQQSHTNRKKIEQTDKIIDYRQILMDWFTGLSEADRINCLTTVCPSRIDNYLLWYRGEAAS
jgi:hypothetical protein